MADATVIGSRPASRAANMAKRFSLIRPSDSGSASTGGGSPRLLPTYQFATVNPQNPQQADETVKIVCVGDGGCGKTCLLVTYARGKFPEAYVPTVFENYVANVRSSDGQLIEVALWDTAGQEEYDRLRALSYPDANVILLCFAVDSPASLDNVYDKWIPEVAHHCPGVPIIIVGLKTDLREDEPTIDRLQSRAQRPLNYEDGLQASRFPNVVRYVECSARTGEGLRDVFDLAITAVVNPRLAKRAVAEEEQHNPHQQHPQHRPLPATPGTQGQATQTTTRTNGRTDGYPYSYPDISSSNRRDKKRRKCIIL